MSLLDLLRTASAKGEEDFAHGQKHEELIVCCTMKFMPPSVIDVPKVMRKRAER